MVVELMLKRRNEWSNRQIARWCKVSREFVRKLRGTFLTDNIASEKQRTYITKHGTVAQMNTANIGKPKAERNNAIVQLYRNGYTQEAIGAMFGLDQGVITRIVGANDRTKRIKERGIVFNTNLCPGHNVILTPYGVSRQSP